MKLKIGLLKDTKAVQFQFIFVLFAVSAYIYIISDSDINHFDDYVLPILSECWPGNNSDFCVDVREHLGCNDSDQQCLGNKYWNQANKNTVMLAFLLSFLRAMPAFVGLLTKARKIRFATIFEIIWYGLMAVIVFIGGAIDVFYYLLRGMSFPVTLPWLNGVGLFVYTKGFTGDKSMVESSDLLITFGMSVVMLFVLFVVALVVYKTTGLKKDIA